jgi:hypothetical protein
MWENRLMHFRPAFDQFKAHPWRFFITTLIPAAVIGLIEHKAYSWALENLNEGASPIFEFLRDVLAPIVAHPIISFLAITGCTAVVVMIITYIIMLIEAYRASESQKKRTATAQEERLRELERRLRTTEESVGNLDKAQTAQTTLLTGLDRVVSQRKEQSDEVYRVLSGRLDEVKPRLARADTATRAFQATLGQIATFGALMHELAILIMQADTAISLLEQIKEQFPQYDVAQRPFSRAWWRQDVVPKADSIVVEWAMLINRHVKDCVEFAAVYSILVSTVLREDLQICTGTWNRATPMEECQGMLQKQKSRLIKFRLELTANLATQVLTSISPTV